MMARMEFANVELRADTKGEILVIVEGKMLGVLRHDGDAPCVRLSPYALRSINVKASEG